MNNKNIGLFALLCSPFLAIDLTVHGGFDNYSPSSIGGLFSFIYMTGWLLSVLALYRMHAGVKKIARAVLVVQMIFLSLAEVSNIWLMIEPGSSSKLYSILDLFWPVSNSFMFVTGLTIILSKQIRGWQRFVPLFVGLWLPTSISLWTLIGKTATAVSFISIYSAVAWSFLALSVYTLPSSHGKQAIAFG
jgi:hypothetical protein